MGCTDILSSTIQAKSRHRVRSIICWKLLESGSQAKRKGTAASACPAGGSAACAQGSSDAVQGCDLGLECCEYSCESLTGDLSVLESCVYAQVPGCRCICPQFCDGCEGLMIQSPAYFYLTTWLDYRPALLLWAFWAVTGLWADPGCCYQTYWGLPLLLPLALMTFCTWLAFCSWLACARPPAAWVGRGQCLQPLGCEPEPPTGSFHPLGELWGIWRLVIRTEDNRAHGNQVFSD